MNRSNKKIILLLLFTIFLSVSINAQEVINQSSAETWNSNKVTFPSYITTHRENLILPKIKGYE
ncbi:MAG TPA: hypothetical protein P5023_08420, partial [Bacteroidales bacterium]|nr:hypothetical protein [Bacteroidales bacterium]